jgi:uncharacterized membrane protein
LSCADKAFAKNRINNTSKNRLFFIAVVLKIIKIVSPILFERLTQLVSNEKLLLFDILFCTLVIITLPSSLSHTTKRLKRNINVNSKCHLICFR